jgi:truncated hemoglobin YjbI
MTTAYEALGGEAKVRAIVGKLYDKLFVDPFVGFLFAGKDRDRIVERQVEFTSAFLGGPARYTGQPLPQAHAALPLLPGHFDRRHWVLGQVLLDEGVPADVRRTWLDIDQALRTSVLAAGGDARDKTHEPA